MYLNIYIQELNYIHTIIGTGWRKVVTVIFGLTG